jgi:hypothetical protein
MAVRYGHLIPATPRVDHTRAAPRDRCRGLEGLSTQVTVTIQLLF